MWDITIKAIDLVINLGLLAGATVAIVGGISFTAVVLYEIGKWIFER
jgi:ABC-type cobalamin transport system permease subunit